MGYFIVEFSPAEASVEQRAKVSSIDGYKGTVRVDFSVSGPGNPQVAPPTVNLSIDEDEYEYAYTTVSGTGPNTVTLTALATDTSSSDMASKDVAIPENL